MSLQDDIPTAPDRSSVSGLHLPRFVDLCARAGIPAGEAAAIGADLLARYAEEGRHYHNLAHIGKMLDWLDKTGAGTPGMELAIWFHDCVYEPLSRENEAASAVHFEQTMGRFLDAPVVAEVVRLILATDFRRPRTGAPDEALLIDLDFSILGSPWKEYDAYRTAVRREYAAVPDADFIPGRSAVLRHFLAGRIFSTDFFAPLEQPARSHIQRELDLLQKTVAKPGTSQAADG